MSEVNLAALTAPFAPNQIKQRTIGGGKQADYVPGEIVIRRLNEATGNNWDLTVKNIDERPMGGGTLVMAMVALTIPGHGTREHIGVQMVQDRGGEDLIKGAITDALKKAASLFGVGLHLYDDEAPARPGPARQQQPQQPKPAAAGTAPEPDGAISGWTDFWPRARAAGFTDKGQIEQAIGRTSDGLSPAELWGLLQQASSGKAVAPAGERPEGTRPAPAVSPPATDPPLTDKQRDALFSFASKKLGERADEVIHALIAMDYGAGSVTQLTKRQASALIDELKTGDEEAIWARFDRALKQTLAPIGDKQAVGQAPLGMRAPRDYTQ